MKKILLKNFLLLSFTAFISCSIADEGKKLDQVSFEEKVANSKEFQVFITAFNEVQKMDTEYYEKYYNYLNNNGLKKENIKNRLLNLNDKSLLKENIDFLIKIGFENPKKYIEKRNQLFNHSIPEAGKDLGHKFPELKKYTEDQLLTIYQNYKDKQK